MTNKEEIDKISNPIFKGERPIYYFVSEEKLLNLKYDSIAGDISFALFTIASGASFTEKNLIYFLLGLFFLGFSVYFYSRKFKFIRDAQNSGEIESFKSEFKEDGLKITKAFYGTFPDKIVDVAEKLNKEISENKLNRAVSNDIAGDPDVGTRKYLEIEYSFGGKTIQKKYAEGEIINIP